jgi:lycopene cyclase domain-containing protein
MQDKYLYLAIVTFSLSVPFIASFYQKHPFYKEWKYLFPSLFIVAVFFIVWDEIFTQRGVWGFNPRYLIGVNILSLPLEEILFFIFIPYSSVFIYFALRYLIKNNPFAAFNRVIYFLLIGLCLVMVIFNYNKLYTFYTFLFLFIFLCFQYFRSWDITFAAFSYIFVLPFFLLTNGILTGSFIEEQVVWYNDSQNLGIRMGTIPVEDTFYGFLLIVLNIRLMQWFKNRWTAI